MRRRKKNAACEQAAFHDCLFSYQATGRLMAMIQ